MTLTVAQGKALAICPKVTGMLSIVGSGIILADILGSKKKLQHPYSRIIVGMSSVDVVTSIVYFLSTWPIPEGSGPIYASGTTGSCTFQGFFVQLSLAGVLYNLCLSIYYLMILRFKFTERRVQKAVKKMHIVVLTIAVAFAIAGLPLTLYNNSNLWCWIASLPATCQGGTVREGGTGECSRGQNAWIYRWAFAYGPVWFCIFALTVVMSFVVSFVWTEERRSRRFRRQDSAITSLSAEVGWQAFYYSLAFYVTWTIPTIVRTMETAGKAVPHPLVLLTSILLPMQGVLNCLIYHRPRYLRYLRKNTEKKCCTLRFRAIIGSHKKSFVELKRRLSSSFSGEVLRRLSGSRENTNDEDEDIATLDPSYSLTMRRQMLSMKQQSQDVWDGADPRMSMAEQHESVINGRSICPIGEDENNQSTSL